ncbi:MAG: DNA polymerase III subunit gamma/tau [Chloracidobacterium sp.]|nr:DNA polymerase III subunit gamma/tau [Chloracidobacterium sp.]
MSYQVIARKWRPQTFEEVTGQEVITQTLKNALEYDRLHHAYLFSGARGVGKTTTARLLAKALNCHKTKDKPNVVPCRTDAPDACPSCIEISESRSMDVLEIDAASHTGVDDIRDTILDGINIRAARDRFKVFIIDEVHMLSRNSFNALLKTLEEPPPNVVFIMATTELHKVPETILSRCQEFEFRTIPLQKIFDRLRLIADAERIDITDEALREIARSGEGSMRDAQSNFDQVISFSGETIGVDDVTNALGLAGSDMLMRVLRAIAEKQPRAALDVVEELTSRGQDLRNFCRSLLGLFRDLLVFKVSGGDEKLAESAALTPEEMAAHSDPFTESDLVRFFNSIAETESKLREASHARYTVEMGLVKLTEMRSVTSVETLLERLAALENRLQQVPDGTQPGDEEKKTLGLAPEPRPEPAKPPHEPAEQLPEPPEEPPIDLGSVDLSDESAPFELETDGSDLDDDAVPGFEADLEPTPYSYDLSFLDSIENVMADLTAEDLEHAADDRLDRLFETRLQAEGDDLKPLQNANELAEVLFGQKIHEGAGSPGDRAVGGPAGTAFAPATYKAPIFEPEPEVEMPELSSSPTEEELLAYASADKTVRTVIKLFRGSITKVRKT